MLNEHRHSIRTLGLWPVKFKFLGVAGQSLRYRRYLDGRLGEVWRGGSQTVTLVARV